MNMLYLKGFAESGSKYSRIIILTWKIRKVKRYENKVFGDDSSEIEKKLATGLDITQHCIPQPM